MQELIVIAACLNSSGCEQSISAYEHYNAKFVASIKETIESAKIPGKEYMPFVYCSVRNSCIFNLDQYSKVQVDTDGIKYYFSMKFQ